MNIIVNSFNNFDVNVGPDLAAKIPEIDINKQNKSLTERNPNTIFHYAVSYSDYNYR